MLCEVVMAGFGGQGILYMGDILAQAAIEEGHNATFLPTYGVAMRGGTANCVVTISDQEIGSPLMDHPHAGIFMNQQSLVKFRALIRPGGIIVVNTSIANPESVERNNGVRTICIPANELARSVSGTDRVANIIALGALLKAQPVVRLETMERLFRESAAPGRKDMIEKNLAAFRVGYEFEG